MTDVDFLARAEAVLSRESFARELALDAQSPTPIRRRNSAEGRIGVGRAVVAARNALRLAFPDAGDAAQLARALDAVSSIVLEPIADHGRTVDCGGAREALHAALGRAFRGKRRGTTDGATRGEASR